MLKTQCYVCWMENWKNKGTPCAIHDSASNMDKDMRDKGLKSCFAHSLHATCGRSTDAIYGTVHVSRGVRTGGHGCYNFHTILQVSFDLTL